jgi:hypothetical protein
MIVDAVVAEAAERARAKNTALFLAALRSELSYLRRFDDATLRNKIGVEKLDEAVDMTFDFLEMGVRETLSQLESYALLCRVIGCLMNYLSHQLQLPLSLKVVVNNLHLINHAVDRAFPYYAKAGLLKVTIQSNAAVK